MVALTLVSFVMEIKITNFSQECVICDRNGEEGICRNFDSRVKTKALSLSTMSSWSG